MKSVKQIILKLGREGEEICYGRGETEGRDMSIEWTDRGLNK